MTMKRVSEILDAISELDEANFNLLLEALDYGMHDEWDCGLPDGLAMFGYEEIKMAVKAAKLFVQGRHNASNN